MGALVTVGGLKISAPKWVCISTIKTIQGTLVKVMLDCWHGEWD
jgi:hypothetical protein